jgi:hypothetical protein
MHRAGPVTPLWLWPNILSLDAPLIAITWQAFLAQRYAVPLRFAGRIELFLAVWAIYIADRLLDARHPATFAEPARHRFYRNHRRLATVLLAALLTAALAIAVFWLRPAVLRNGLVPLAAVALYLAALNVGRPRQVAKELVVAFVFTAGTFLVAWTNDPLSPLTLLAPAAAFLLLCLANLSAIEKWEGAELRVAADPPHVTTRAMVRTARIWIPLFALLALLRGSDPWYLAIGISAAAIAALLYSGTRLRIEARRVLVDAVLFTPLLFLYTSGV